jgi:uncharacterized protein (DUF427 family)
MSTAERPAAEGGARTAVARAVWDGVVLAETTCPVLLEGNAYFPPEDVRHEHLAASGHWSLCAWKGLARYYTVRAGGQQNTNAAWYYPHPARSPAKSKPCRVLERRPGKRRPGVAPQTVPQPRGRAVPDAGSAPGTTPGGQG